VIRAVERHGRQISSITRELRAMGRFVHIIADWLFSRAIKSTTKPGAGLLCH
jgi:hypothetical protein